MSELALGRGGIAAPDLGRVLVAVGALEDRERMRRWSGRDVDAGRPASPRTRVAAALARAWLRERERECREQVFRLVGAVAAEHGTVRLPGSDGLAGSDNPFAVLERVLARMAEEVRECEHLLRRRSDQLRTGA